MSDKTKTEDHDKNIEDLSKVVIREFSEALREENNAKKVPDPNKDLLLQIREEIHKINTRLDDMEKRLASDENAYQEIRHMAIRLQDSIMSKRTASSGGVPSGVIIDAEVEESK